MINHIKGWEHDSRKRQFSVFRLKGLHEVIDAPRPSSESWKTILKWIREPTGAWGHMHKLSLLSPCCGSLRASLVSFAQSQWIALYGPHPVVALCFRPDLVLDLQLHACFVCSQALKYQNGWRQRRCWSESPPRGTIMNGQATNIHTFKHGLPCYPWLPGVVCVGSQKKTRKQNGKKPTRKRYSSEPNEEAKHHKFPCGQSQGR